VEGLAEALAGLPPAGRFTAFGLVGLAVLSGLAFGVRGLAPVRWLAAAWDRALTALVAALLLAMVFLSGLQILLRNVFDAGLLWIDPLLRHFVLLLAFSGAVLATGAKRHVQINVLGRLLSGVAARVSGVLVAALGSVVCLVLAHASLQLLRDELDFGETVFLDVPSWAVVSVFPLAFLLIAYRFAYLAWEEATGEAPASDGETSLLEGVDPPHDPGEERRAGGREEPA
jgi:TRAP-type C4-dicarboxylate transport system permease small subunit